MRATSLATTFGVLAFLLCFPAPARSEVYTTYSFNGPSEIDASTCGSTGSVAGCFGGAGTGITHLHGPCAMLESAPSVSGKITTQELYVLETGSDAAPAVALKVYTKKIIIQPDNVITRISLKRSVTILNLHGGAGRTCMIAANPTSLFLGIVGAENAVQINRKNFAGHRFGGDSPQPQPFTSMTANEAGYVSVYFGGGLLKSFYLFGPDGKNVSGGGAGTSVFIPNQTNGISLK